LQKAWTKNAVATTNTTTSSSSAPRSPQTPGRPSVRRPRSSPRIRPPALRRLGCRGRRRTGPCPAVAAYRPQSTRNDRDRVLEVLARGSSVLTAAFATSLTTGCDRCCTAVSGGRLTGLRDCKAVPHPWRRRAVNDNAPPADRIVCRGRAGEQIAPPRASVSENRQPTERDIEAAAGGGPATSQGGIWIRIASSRSHRQSWPAHFLCASLA
jgi:hypothetical protein